MGPSADVKVTAADIELLMGARGVTKATVYIWANRGKIKSCGKLGRSPLYRWSDVVAVELETRGRIQSRRHDDRLLAA